MCANEVRYVDGSWTAVRNSNGMLSAVKKVASLMKTYQIVRSTFGIDLKGFKLDRPRDQLQITEENLDQVPEDQREFLGSGWYIATQIPDWVEDLLDHEKYGWSKDFFYRERYDPVQFWGDVQQEAGWNLTREEMMVFFPPIPQLPDSMKSLLASKRLYGEPTDDHYEPSY